MHHYSMNSESIRVSYKLFIKNEAISCVGEPKHLYTAQPLSFEILQ
jgi:hypothetical protein